MFIGNQSIQGYFNKLIKSEDLNHAYLFYGPEGVGKKLFALMISEALSGAAVNNPDLRIIDKGNGEVHIAEIRDLRSFIHLTPFGKYKVAIINNAHNLGRDGSNALLKILEEPPGKSILFLISHLPKMMLPTVISRCQLLRFRPLEKGEIYDYLINENKIKKDVAEICAKLAHGSLSSAIELANGFDNFQKDINLLDKLVKTDLKERFDIAKRISGSSEDLRKTAENWFIYSASLPDKKIAAKILCLNDILSRPQFNHRLALENFLINI